MPYSFYVVILVLASLTAAPTTAQETNRFAISLGIYDVFNSGHGAEAQIEYRFKPWKLGLIPAAGFMLTDKDGTNYVFGDFRYDVRLSKHWVFTPQLAGAIYNQGDGKDLGGDFQFRTAVEFAYRLKSGARLGLLISHLSNAGIHDRNPGVNSLLVSYSF